MNVTIFTLDMHTPPTAPPRPLPDDVRLDRAPQVSPEYARFLYGLVGGPWNWTDRLGWSRQQWLDDVTVPGTEFWILYGQGVPLGYVHLQPLAVDEGTQVEVRYFGLAEQAIGQGLGGRLLEHAVQAAWTLPERWDFASTCRVWVHTCSLDGPAALTNYQARGFVLIGTEETEVDVADQPPGAWLATGGPAATADEPTDQPTR